MNSLRFLITIILCLSLFSSCDNFEKKLFSQLEEKQINAIKNGSDTFDLATITDFQWDSVILIKGNESVPEYKEFLEERLSGTQSKIHWEDRRFKKRIDPTLRWRTKDLPVNKDRFYFLTPDKRLIEKEINSGSRSHQLSFTIEDKNPDTFYEEGWMSKKDCKFLLKNVGKQRKHGTVLLSSINRITSANADNVASQVIYSKYDSINQVRVIPFDALSGNYDLLLIGNMPDKKIIEISWPSLSSDGRYVLIITPIQMYLRSDHVNAGINYLYWIQKIEKGQFDIISRLLVEKNKGPLSRIEDSKNQTRSYNFDDFIPERFHGNDIPDKLYVNFRKLVNILNKSFKDEGIFIIIPDRKSFEDNPQLRMLIDMNELGDQIILPKLKE